MSDHQRILEGWCQQELQSVLQSSHYIQGLIFAVASAPEIPMPETWLVWVFKQRGQLTSVEQADKLTDVLMGLLQSQLKDMRDEKVCLPSQYTFSDASPDESAVSQWLTGLLAGHSQLESVWQSAWDKVAQKQPDKLPEMQKDLVRCLKMFSTFANVPLAISQANELGNHALLTQLPSLFNSLDATLRSYVKLSGDLVDFMPDQFETFVQH